MQRENKMKRILLFFVLLSTILSAQDTLNYTAAQIDSRLTSTGLTADTTLNFTTSMSATEIMAEINGIPKNLGAYTLTLQWADGNYSFAEKILIEGYYNGIIENVGNASDNSNSTTKSVNIDFSHSGFGFHFFNCFALINTRYMKISFTSGIGYLVEKSYYTYVDYCYIVGDDNTTTTGIQLATSNFGRVTRSTIGLCNYGVFGVTGGMIWTKDNVSGAGANSPVYGVVVSDACTIVKTGTDITGTTADNLVADGGLVRE
jgi:hypothetical protein